MRSPGYRFLAASRTMSAACDSASGHGDRIKIIAEHGQLVLTVVRGE
jgi:hypothetical protein